MLKLKKMTRMINAYGYLNKEGEEINPLEYYKRTLKEIIGLCNHKWINWRIYENNYRIVAVLYCSKCGKLKTKNLW